MVSFTARFTFAPEDRNEIAEVLRLVTSESRREPGCVTYIPHHVEGDPDTIVIYEQYKDASRTRGASGLGAFQEVCRRRAAAEDENPHPRKSGCSRLRVIFRPSDKEPRFATWPELETEST